VSAHMLRLNRILAACGMTVALVLAFASQSTAQVFVGPDAAVRFEGVKPTKTLVYLDGYYAGIVDDFDGVFQRLYTAPGPHEITLFLEGYRTFTQHAYLTPDHTFKVRHQMELLQPGETSEKPPAPPPPPPPDQQTTRGPRGPNSRRQEPPADQQPAPHEQGRGTLELTLQPADAEVIVDGQSWQRTGADHVTVDLAAGPHNLQIRKSGYVGYLTDVDIRPSETTTLDVNLKAQAPR
jgi:hypothetical protein